VKLDDMLNAHPDVESWTHYVDDEYRVHIVIGFANDRAVTLSDMGAWAFVNSDPRWTYYEKIRLTGDHDR